MNSWSRLLAILLALGFVPNTTDHNQPYLNGADPWMLMRENGQTQAFSNGNTTTEFDTGVNGNTGPTSNTMQLVLNTMGANWSVAGFINVSLAAEFIRAAGEDFSIVCAGRQQHFCVEDAVCAGMIVKILAEDAAIPAELIEA